MVLGYMTSCKYDCEMLQVCGHLYQLFVTDIKPRTKCVLREWDSLSVRTGLSDPLLKCLNMTKAV